MTQPRADDPRADDTEMDRPTAAELLAIMAETMSESVVPATATQARHQARVVANLCQILARELGTSSRPSFDLPESLLGVTDDIADALYDDVLASVRAKLAINKPGYDDHGADQERSIIA